MKKLQKEIMGDSFQKGIPDINFVYKTAPTVARSPLLHWRTSHEMKIPRTGGMEICCTWVGITMDLCRLDLVTRFGLTSERSAFQSGTV